MFVLALTLAALAVTASATGYEDGKEYVYSYYGQIYSGFPRIKSQYAGEAFKTDLIIQPHGDTAIFKIDHIQKSLFNQEFEDVARHPFQFADAPEMLDVFTKPFKVYRHKGVVTHFETDKDEPMFSVNVKRGIVSLFNLHLEDDEHQDENDLAKTEEHKSEEEKHYYTLYEKGVLGDCETAYVIEHHHDHSHDDNIVLNVTKVRNYHKCRSSPSQVYGVFHGHECGEAQHEKSHTLHGNAQFKYNIRGYRHHYVIEKVITAGEVAYTPYPIEGQTVATHINRVLTLKEERPVTEELVFTGGHDHTSLVYEFSFHHDYKDEVDLKKAHYLYHVSGRKVSLDVINAEFEDLLHFYNDETYHENLKDKNFPEKFLELHRSFGTLDYDDIENLYKQHADIPKSGATEQQKLSRNLFLDTLVNLGTNPALLFGKYLVENKKLNPSEASYFIKHIPLHVKEVSEHLFDEFQELCEHESVKKHEHVHIDCVLAFSTAIYDHCIARYHPEIPHSTDKQYCQPIDAVKYFNYFSKHYEEATDETLKIAYIKAMGNVGLKEILPYAKPYVEGAGDAHNYVRSTAIWALSHVGHRFPDQVRELLVPLLFNHSEKHELRLAAFTLILKHHPHLYELEGLARALVHDPDDQFKSYIYSTFQHYANSTHSCDKKLATDAHYVLRILDEHHHDFDHYDYTYSKHHYTGGHDDHYDFGGSTRFSYFASDSGYVPRSAYLGVEDFLGGKSFQTFGLGFKQYGIEKVLDKFIGPYGSLGKRSLFDLFKKRPKREVSGVEKELNEIKSKLHLPVHDYEHIHGELFFKYMGSQLSFFHFDDHTFESFFKEGRFSIPELLPAYYQKVPSYNYQRFLLPVDKLYIIPTESGVPLAFDYKQPIYYFHHNKESSFKVEPGFFPEDRAGKFPDHVKAETDGYFAIDKNLFASMSVVMPHQKLIFGAGINRRATLSLPLKLKVDLDEKEKKLTTKWTPVAPHEVYHYKYEPFTFVDHLDNTIPKTKEEEYHPVHKKNRKEHHLHYMHDAFGVGFDVNAHSENEFLDRGSMLEFLFEKDFREKFYYLYANPNFEPYDVDVEFTYAKEGATKEVETSFQYHYYDEDHAYPEFATEHFEDYHEQEDRAPLCTCAIEAELKGHGDKERNAHATLSWTRDLKRTYHKLNFYYDRTPFAHDETDHFKICGSTFYKYPKYDHTKIATLDTIDMDHTVKSGAKIHFGKDCSTQSQIHADGKFYTTDEQREYESHREEPDTPEHYNPYAHAYQRCLEERKKGLHFGEHCMEYFELVTTVHHYDIDVKHEHLSDKFLNCTYRAGRFLRHLMFYHGDHNLFDVHNTENELKFHANYSIHAPIVDIKVKKPHSESHYTNVHHPGYHAFRSYPQYEDIHVKNSFSETMCKLEGDHVYTFDHYEYNLPPIDCYKVIAKDCSPNEHFAVLGTKITHPKYHKAIKIFLGKHKIEALPVSDDSDIIVRVDGKRVVVTDSEPYFHHEKEGHDHHHSPDFYITHRDFYYALHSEKYGVIVSYDGHNILVQVSPFYRAKLCGLCGNFNGQKYDGLEDEHGCYYEDAQAYAYAYAIPSDTCSVPHVEKKCPNEGGNGCTKLRTKVVERSSGTLPETCFSTEPVAECASHCKASSTVSKTLSFHCLPSKDDSTKNLVRQHQHRVIHEVKRKSKDHEATVEVPDTCLKA